MGCSCTLKQSEKRKEKMIKSRKLTKMIILQFKNDPKVMSLARAQKFKGSNLNFQDPLNPAKPYSGVP